MTRKRPTGPHDKSRPDRSSPAARVMRAFRSAKFAAPRFMSSCGVFPEVSESASDRLHAIVHDLATRQLNQGRHLRALQKRLHQLAASTRRKTRKPEDLIERIGADLTAILAAEATAAYVFGLSVGLTMRSLPERFDA